MKTVRLDGREIAVQEIGRPTSKRLCRHLTSISGGEHFLEYVISVGPFQFDLPVVHRLTDAETAAYLAGTLQLGELAERLAGDDERSGRYERSV